MLTSVGQGSRDEKSGVCEGGIALVLWKLPCVIEVFAVNHWLAMMGVVVWQKRFSKNHVLVPSEVKLHHLLISHALVDLAVFPAPPKATLQRPYFGREATQVNLITRVKNGEHKPFIQSKDLRTTMS
jgi:hypothetical protein